jgi:PKD repeat protein
MKENEMKTKITLNIALAIGLTLLSVTAVWAVPPLPSGFWGTAADVAEGTLVEFCIDGVCYAQTTTSIYNGNPVYNVDVPGDDPETPEVEGGKEGDIIVIVVGGQIADQTAVWHGGTNIELNLTISAVGPTADFSCTTTGTLTINCSDQSIVGSAPITAWVWDFGDSSTSTEQNPTHTFSAAGAYPFQLTVTDASGLSDSITKTVIVSPAGSVTIRIYPAAPTVGVGSTVTIQVVVENVTGLYAFDVTLVYNALAEAVSIEGGPDWQDGFEAQNVVDNDNHQARLAITLLGDGSLSGNVVLATVTLRGVQDGTVPLSLSASGLWNRQSQEIPHDVQGSEITVDAMLHVQGMCLLQARTDHSGCTVAAGGTGSTTDLQGQYEVSVPAGAYGITASAPGYLQTTTSCSGVAGEIRTLPNVELRAGDVNGDCIVNILDLAAIGGCYGESATCNPTADFTNDGTISMPDLVAAAVNYLKECPQPWDLIP